MWMILILSNQCVHLEAIKLFSTENKIKMNIKVISRLLEKEE
jgi:hypothetical protein